MNATNPAPRTLATDYTIHCVVDGAIRYLSDENDPVLIAMVDGWVENLSESELYDNMAQACRGPYSGLTGGYTLEGLRDLYIEHKSIIDSKGTGALTIIGYEGGSHMSTPYDRQSNEGWVAALKGFMESPQWASVFDEQIDLWYEIFGPTSTYCRRSDVRPADMHQAEGLHFYIGHISPQVTVWNEQRASRQQGATPTNRRFDAFIGPYDLAE